jgi:hypothetical protein
VQEQQSERESLQRVIRFWSAGRLHRAFDMLRCVSVGGFVCVCCVCVHASVCMVCV